MVIDKATGRVDLRFNPMSSLDDYYIPVRGGESGTKIETLAGGQNTAAVEDVQYIQKKLFAALKIPKAYLGYDEEIGSKATLAQEDIRFSRTITRIQKVIISELNKIAMIHLYSHGFTDESLLNFKLMLNNPSSVAQLQKLELIKTKFDIAGAAPEGVVDRAWIRKNVLGLTEEDIERVKEGRKADKIEDSEVESAQAEGSGDVGGGEDTGGGEEPELAGGGEGDEGAENLFASYEPVGRNSMGLPVKPSNEVNSMWPKKGKPQENERINKKEEQRKHNRNRTHMPNFGKEYTQNSISRPHGDPITGKNLREDDDMSTSLIDAMLGETSVSSAPRITGEMENIFKMLSSKIGNKLSNGLLSEALDDLGDSEE